MALILLRHGQPEIAAGICYGRSDVPARALGEGSLRSLVTALPDRFARIDSSPLTRCNALAERKRCLGPTLH